MKKIILLLIVFLFHPVIAQNVNDYKYALVPSSFSIFNGKDNYRLNTLAKMYMQKYGFESYLDNESQPLEFSSDPCNKVYVDITEDSNMFVTKLKVVIKDCGGKIIATSNEGISREKEYHAAYNEALRFAFNSFTLLLNHKYKGVDKKNSVEIKSVPEPIIIDSKSVSYTLFAQPISNGYQLIDNEPKVILKIYFTSEKDFYIATKGNSSGVFFKKNGNWYFEHYENDTLVSEVLAVKM